MDHCIVHFFTVFKLLSRKYLAKFWIVQRVEMVVGYKEYFHVLFSLDSVIFQYLSIINYVYKIAVVFILFYNIQSEKFHDKVVENTIKWKINPNFQMWRTLFDKIPVVLKYLRNSEMASQNIPPLPAFDR